MDNVIIERSVKRSTIGIRILPDGKVKVTIPFLYPKMFVHTLLKEKEGWIKEKQQLLQSRKISSKKAGYYYLGKLYQLEPRIGQKELIEIADKLYIGSTNDKYRKTYLTAWYKKEARRIIVARVEKYAKKNEAEYRSVSITSAETRWGSCSSKKTLNFNWKLVMAPIEVIDYVVVHELAHLTELNHSKAFWEEVRKMYPLYRQYRTWLNRHGHLLSV